METVNEYIIKLDESDQIVSDQFKIPASFFTRNVPKELMGRAEAAIHATTNELIVQSFVNGFGAVEELMEFQHTSLTHPFAATEGIRDSKVTQRSRRSKADLILYEHTRNFFFPPLPSFLFFSDWFFFPFPFFTG